MSTLWLKTLRDLWLFKARTALVVLAIAVGTAAVGMSVTSLIVLRRDLRDGYRATNPAHAILATTPFDLALAEQVAALPEVAAAEARRLTVAQITLAGQEPRPLMLWTIPDLAAVSVGMLEGVAPFDKLRYEAAGDLYLERSAGEALGVAVGDEVTARFDDGNAFPLVVAGFVHDLAVAPTTVQPTVYGYISDDTAARLGLPESYDQLHLRVSALDDLETEFLGRNSVSTAENRAAVERAVTAVGEWLEDEGVVVLRAGIPEPGVHLMQGNVDTGLLMMGILGGLTLLLSAFLVTNVMTAVMVQQLPQIGVLKALGGSQRLVRQLYLRMVLILGGLALLLAVPAGLAGAWFQSQLVAGQLNFDIPSFGLTASVLLVQAVGALLAPLLAAWGPLRAAGRLSVRQTMAGTIEDTAEETTDYTDFTDEEPHAQSAKSAKSAKRKSSWRSWRSLRKESSLQSVESVESVVPASLLTLLSWRNVARRRGRVALTVGALALAGAMFMATFGLRLGLYEAIEVLVGEFPADVVIDTAAPQPGQRLTRAAAGLPGVARVEAWGVADARRVYDDGRVGSSFTLYGVPPTTQIAPFAEREGQWLNEAEISTQRRKGAKTQSPENSGLCAFPSLRLCVSLPSSLYINYETEKLTARPAVGEAVALRINGVEEAATRVVGISLRPFEAQAFMPYAEFERATGQRGRAGRLMVYLETEFLRRNSVSPIAQELVARLEGAGVAVARAETAASYRAGYRAQFDTLVALLMGLAGLTALVGGLGLGNTMALNVLERSREIGVLRAMGARRPLLRRLVLAEGLVVALASVVPAVLLALPLTAALDGVMGRSLLGHPLRFAFSPAAALGWLGLVVVIGLLACWLPAARAGRMTVREAVSYE